MCRIRGKSVIISVPEFIYILYFTISSTGAFYFMLKKYKFCNTIAYDVTTVLAALLFLQLYGSELIYTPINYSELYVDE
jgi:hypothetical protein